MRTITGASNRVTVNLGIPLPVYGPQTNSDPKFDTNFYDGDPNLCR